MSQLSWRQISSANLGFAFPEKILMPPVVLMASSALCFVLSALFLVLSSGVYQPGYKSTKHQVQRSKLGWGGWIRTNECRFQRPVPYHLATPQNLFAVLRERKKR